MPDVLCMSHVLKYEKSTRGEVPGWRGADDLAKELQGAACDGTDPAIPLALPHTRAINSSRKGEVCMLYAFEVHKCRLTQNQNQLVAALILNI